MSSLAYLPSSPTLFNSGTRHTQMSSCYLVDSPARRARLDLRPLRAGRPAVEVRRRHRHRVVAGALARLADPRHQRPVQRHRAVAAHARRLGRRGQPGRPAQGRGLRLPGAVAPRRRGVPRAARQHRRGRPPHPQPQPGATGSPTSSCAGSRPTSAWSLFDPDEVPELPDLWGEAFDAAYRAAEAEGRLRAPGRRPRALRPDDAHAGADRQRLDDLQGRRQPHLQPDRARPATSCTCPTCAPRSSRSPATARPRCATSARSTSPRTWSPPTAPARRLGQAAGDRAHRGAAARPGHRHQLLPEPRRPRRQPAVAAGRPGRDGAAGRLLRAARCRSTPPRRWRCRPGSPRRST